MKRGHEYHRTKEQTKPYCGFNWDTGDKFEGVFLTAEQAEQKRIEGHAVEQAERFTIGLPYGA